MVLAQGATEERSGDQEGLTSPQPYPLCESSARHEFTGVSRDRVARLAEAKYSGDSETLGGLGPRCIGLRYGAVRYLLYGFKFLKRLRSDNRQKRRHVFAVIGTGMNSVSVSLAPPCRETRVAPSI